MGRPGPRPLDPCEVTAALLDPESGLCATGARFTEAHVYEHVAAQSGGRWTTAEITSIAGEFLASEHVVRLMPDAGERRRPPEWSNVAHRALEDAVLERAAHPTERELRRLGGLRLRHVVKLRSQSWLRFGRPERLAGSIAISSATRSGCTCSHHLEVGRGQFGGTMEGMAGRKRAPEEPIVRGSVGTSPGSQRWALGRSERTIATLRASPSRKYT